VAGLLPWSLVGQGEKAERSSTDVHPADGKQTKSDKLKDFGLTTSNPALAFISVNKAVQVRLTTAETTSSLNTNMLCSLMVIVTVLGSSILQDRGDRGLVGKFAQHNL
jgi:hypothetical protein